MTSETTLNFRVAIPARYAATRFPGKPLIDLAGLPMIQRVYRQGVASGAEEVVIATDDERVRAVAEGFGASVVMTATEHRTGTDRLAEMVDILAWRDDQIVVNLQGDEPLMSPALIRQVARGLEEHPDAGIATVCHRLHSIQEVLDPNIVKVVMDAHGYALYFSRAPIPYQRDETFFKEHDQLPDKAYYFRHIGLYAYRVGVLRRYPKLAPCEIEQAEVLEQLRALWNGIRIHVQETLDIPPIGVDVPGDIARVEAYLRRDSSAA